MSATQPRFYQQTEVRPYVDLFETESVMRGNITPVPRQLKISFILNERISVDAPDRSVPPFHVIGYCFISKVDSPTIAIDSAYWANAPVEERLALVFHELGHCLLYREHDDRMVTMGGRDYPASLMHSTLITGPYLWRYLNYYIDELFLAGDPDPLVW